MQDLQNQTFEYYKELYEKELKKNEELTEALVTAEQQRDDYKFHLDNIHNSLLWRVMYPFRICFSHVKNFFIRIKRYSSLKQLMKKIQSKIIERKAYKSYGTNSMPSIEEIKRQRETVFSKDITISILVPLYNTPEKFLREMIESVINQTYVKWELCLADGSDDAHKDVERICMEYVNKDAEAAKAF